VPVELGHDGSSGGVDLHSAALEAPVAAGESGVVRTHHRRRRIDQTDTEDGKHGIGRVGHAAESTYDEDVSGVHSAAGEPELAARLRRRGMRMTAQREQVLAAVRELGHATPEQLAEAVPAVDVTTVYRTLEVLEDLGLVKHTHLGHGAPAYRPADDDHIHVVCHSCGTVLDASPDLVDALAGRLRSESGFELDRSHFTVFGRCEVCRAAEQTGGLEHLDRP
jgi:Fur family ferric uptake transcriptional regulator